MATYDRFSRRELLKTRAFRTYRRSRAVVSRDSV